MHRLLLIRRLLPALAVALAVPLTFAAGAWFQRGKSPEPPAPAPRAPHARTVVDPPAPPIEGPREDSSPDEVREFARAMIVRAYDHVYEPFRTGIRDLRAEFESDVWGEGVFYWRAPNLFAVQLTSPRAGQNPALIALEIYDLFRGRRTLLDEMDACGPAVAVTRADFLLKIELDYPGGQRPNAGPRSVKHRSLVLDNRPVLQRQVIQYSDGGRDEVSYQYDYLSEQLVAAGTSVLSSGRSHPLQLRQTYTTQGSIRLPLRHHAVTPDGRDLSLLKVGDFEVNRGVPDSVFTAARTPASEK